MKKNIIFIPLILILVIQYFDREDNYFFIQIILAAIVFIIVSYSVVRNKKRNDK